MSLTKRTAAIIMMVLVSGWVINAQDFGNKASADNNLKGSGRVNPSTLGMEFSLPLGSFPGRGIDVPISLSYTSKVWRSEFLSKSPISGTSGYPCFSHYKMVYSEKAASGWTTSMAVPYIEYIGTETIYDNNGLPVSDDLCGGGGGDNPHFFVKRIMVHLPSGETHEMRLDDTARQFIPNITSGSPNDTAEWNGTYYAADGSNMQFVQNSSTNEYRLRLSDGSFYNFDNSFAGAGDRKATAYTDRNGNSTTYYGPGSIDSNSVTHVNGYWQDTLGRNVSIPLGVEAPTSPTASNSPQEYSLPGMTGNYKFHWKQLKGSSAPESGLTNFSDNLQYPGSVYNCNNPYPTYCWQTNGALFNGGVNSRIVADDVFNPIVLTKIELPTGDSYEFKYDVYGRIEQIHYPTGGEEHFTYEVVPTLSRLDPSDEVGGIANFGVVRRELLKTSSDSTPYVWEYEADYQSPNGYAVRVENPDGTKSERFLHRGNDSCSGCEVGTFGYDNGLAGMSYEERSFDSSDTLVSRSLTRWEIQKLAITISPYSGSSYSHVTSDAQWHPRVIQNESIVYDPSGNGDALSSTSKIEYEGDLSQRSTPLLSNKTTQYAFVAMEGGGSLAPELPDPGSTPNPEPTPIPTPIPSSSPIKIVETQYLISDANYSAVKANYTNQNMVGLATGVTVKDGAGTVVSRSQYVYDESGKSPGYRGNPTSLKVWDSTKGIYSNSAAYITTTAKFDTYGNQYESTDALGNTSTTTFDATYHKYPIQVTSAVPDPTGVNGSNAAFISSATFDVVTGLPLTMTDANGLETRITYDPVTLRPTTVKKYLSSTQVGNESQTIYHDEEDNYWVKNRTQIDETKWAESITYYDGLGRAYKTETLNSEGNIFVEKEFDADGRPKRVTNPYRTGETKQWTTTNYDEAGRVKEIVTPDNAKVITDYGVVVAGSNIGSAVTVTDQAGKMRRSISDALGQLTRVDEPNAAGELGSTSSPNQHTTYSYDALGNLKTVSQGVQTRTFAYNSLSQLTSAVNPESGTISYAYDNNSNLTSKTDARSITTNYSYDALNRVKQRSYSGESGYTTPTVNYFYDNKTNAKGLLTKVSSSISTTEYTSFDILGRVTGHKQTTDGQEYSTAYAYNLSGAMVEKTYPSGRVVKNVIDNNGDLSMVQSGKCIDGTPATNATCTNISGLWNYAENFTYNSAGAVTSMQLGNHRWETTQFNSRLQPTQIALGSTNGANNLLKLDYTYGTTNNNGNVLSQKITVKRPSQSDLVFDQSYTYDSVNRLKSAEEISNSLTTWKQVYEFDRFGNRNFNESQTTTLPKSCMDGGNPAVCVADKNKLNPTLNASNNRMATGQGYTYDAAGNTITDADGRTFTYDAENKQTEVENSLSQTVGQYFYDGDGKRIKKIVPQSNEVTVFVYDAGGQLIGEYSTNIPSKEDAKVQYLTNDHLGSPRINTDRDGNVTSRTDYMPYGEEIIGLGNRTINEKYVADTVRQGFTGYENDAETDLDFAQARMFSSKLGRFLVPDEPFLDQSESVPQSWNLYSYVRNNPLKFIDPSGTLAEDNEPGFFEGLSNWLFFGFWVTDAKIKEMAQERRETLKKMKIGHDDGNGNVRLFDLDALNDSEVFALARHVADLEESGQLKRFTEEQLAEATSQDPIMPPVGITKGPRAPKHSGGWKPPSQHADDVIKDTINRAKESSGGLESGRHGMWMRKAGEELRREAIASKKRGDLPEYWQKLERKAKELINQASRTNHPGGGRN